MKRPSMVATYEVTTPGAGLGLFVRNVPTTPDGTSGNELVAIAGGVLTTSPGVFVQETHILTSVQSGDVIGLFASLMGSISPTTFGVFTITDLYSSFPGATQGGTLAMTGSPAQNAFTSITVGGVVKLSADATFGGGTWSWTGATLVAATGDLQVIIL